MNRSVSIDLLTQFELRGRKRREFDVWRDAVDLWNSDVPHRMFLARRLQRELAAVRQFRPPAADETVAVPASAEALRAYLHGFLCAEGSLGLDRSRSTLTVHLRQDDRPLLEMFARAFGVGDVRDHRAYPPSQPSSLWRVGRRDEVVSLARWLTPGELRGREATELEPWLRAVARRANARDARRPPDTSGLIAAFRAAREYQPGRPLPMLAARDRRGEALEILRSWAEAEVGSLSCHRYEQARRTGWPKRETIARRFGSWDAALRAAGLADRAASTAEVRKARAAGGAEVRAARTEAQRERVLATLRYGINIHGSVPTAMQFFRWRLVDAPATPTQGTIYRLFPGGWPAVLAALKESSPDVMSTIPH